MTYPQLDRSLIKMESLAQRVHKKRVETDFIQPGTLPPPLPPRAMATIEETANRIREARADQRPVMLAFGAHAIKNGLAPVLAQLIQEGWLTHLATNGAAIIHDWEFSFFGMSCEHVEPMVNEGRFGNWQETGFLINLALNIGAYEGRGYGESIGALIENEGLIIPSDKHLADLAVSHLSTDASQSAVCADLLAVVRRFDLKTGFMSVPHPWKKFSLQRAALLGGVPLTGHPMFGHDIIYNHPMNNGALLGRTAERDFLIFAEGVSRLEGGVFLSMGSAIMSPMVFEKSLSMAQNLAIQRGTHIDHHFIVVNDLAESQWDWEQGEPPENNPAYYLRFNKTFSRMGGTFRYVSADNRDFILSLAKCLGAVANP